MIRPVKNNRVTSDYGPRIKPYEGMHQGIDYGAIDTGALGDIVMAADDGIVKVSRWQYNHQGFGRYIIIEHSTYCTLYAHLNSFNVKNGQTVSKGQTIGYMGTSGNSTGVHLHFGVFNCLYKNFFTKGSNGFKYPIRPVFEEERDDYKALYEEAKLKLDRIGALL